ncbi:Nucleoid-associated protein [Pontiella desulfatans]|uniref:Nucleoid-associated protein PDESU_04209 n=1 Tax=Pontiella desulfatans TaxID=2750659 RepID=A0A6C2U876_PONDE|nr:YbaB/EbfC family nucleoid-associated protein [Pontiella desulfatans]VGO15624.1 Nucleoid-associated protein [Pontiella desulfatans]
MNMMKMMKQAQDLQKNMKKKQAELAKTEVQFTAGGGMVTVTATCDMKVTSIKINPDAVDPEDVEMLEDLVLAAVDGALNTAQETMSKEMGKLTQGMGLPAGMDLPF